MKYAKPVIVTTASAIVAIRSMSKANPQVPDSEIGQLPQSASAYEADE